MQIDWLTVAAQILNFLVLVWLLQRFLYKPITNAMRRREERIEERLSEAKAAREQAAREEERLKDKEAELEASKDDILASAREESDELRDRLNADLREEMEEKRETWRKHLAEERGAFVASLRRQAGHRVLDITGRILADFADTEMSERVVKTFADRLASLEPETREKMSEAASRKQEAAVVETAAALESAAKRSVTRAIHEILSTDIDVDYRQDAEMVLGIRLTIGDHLVEWSASRYLERLETEFDEIIDAVGHATGVAERGAGEHETA